MVIGNGEEVLSQIPSSNSLIYEKTGKILLYTSDNNDDHIVAVVPDVVGKTPQEANILISNSNLNIKITGSKNFKTGDEIKVISQYPSAGAELKAGEVVTVYLLHTDDKE